MILNGSNVCAISRNIVQLMKYSLVREMHSIPAFFILNFRYLSHRFHGKGSGKIKTEKRMKKIMEEGAMKNMSSTDTPLNTLQKLKARQSETATPYLILTGNKSNPATDITDIRK